MSIVRWDPFRNMATLQDRINRLFDDAFPRSSDGEDLSFSDWRPLVDIYEVKEGVTIQVDLPGVDKKDVSVEVKENALTIKGERKSEATISEESYYLKERTLGTFQRSFVMQAVIDPEAIKATFKNGVLIILVPHPQEDKTTHVSVDIE